MAAMTIPRRLANCRNTVMNSSRPRTTTMIQSGRPTLPNGVMNGNVGARRYIGTKVPTSSALSASGSRRRPRSVSSFRDLASIPST